VVEGFDRIVEIIAVVCLFGFLQSYFLNRGFMVGYIFFLAADKATIDEIRSKSSDTNSSKTSSRKKASNNQNSAATTSATKSQDSAVTQTDSVPPGSGSGVVLLPESTIGDEKAQNNVNIV